MIINPGDHGGVPGGGTVTIDEVVAILYARIISGQDLSLDEDGVPIVDSDYEPLTARIPFSVQFSAVPFDNEEGEQSVGNSLTLIIEGFPPVQFIGQPENWSGHTQRFIREGEYNAMLTVIGGGEIRTDMVVITALQAPPLDSDNLIIRAVKIAALSKTERTFETVGDQV